MNRHASVFVALLVVAVAASVPVGATSTSQRPTFMTPFDPQGSFEVQALVNGFWQRVGELRYDRYIRERAITLPAAALSAPNVRIRLLQHGGGAAQIDRAVLGETPPSRVAGAAESDAVALAARRDNDVLDAFGKRIEVTFPGGTRETFLRLAARVEPPVNEGDPFAFPPANQRTPLTAASAFYTYRPTATGSKPAWPTALDPSKALFAEFCRPSTGHPDGMTYGWVTNDRDTLYAEVEFTSDNTRDGNKDFSSITVLQDGRLKEFRVSEDRTRWGFPTFAVTDRAAYHHKLYTFAIPFAELGARSAAEAAELKLAFNAYGTSAVIWMEPYSHDFGGVELGQSSSPFLFIVRNHSATVSFTLDSPYISNLGPDSTQFAAADVSCSAGKLLAPGDSCTFQVTFSPTVGGELNDTFRVNIHYVNGGTDWAGVDVSGYGGLGIPTFSPMGIALLVLALCGLGYLILRRR
jgi:hypothetical protein